MVAGEKGAPSIEILLAVYNGEEYLGAQLDSLLFQSDSDWRLLIRDDGSRDDTLAIIRRRVKKHPGRIRLLRDDDGNLGPRAAFSRLLEQATAPYLMFCDQDDIWRPDKIARSREKMEELEAKHGPEQPLLLFSDTSLVDQWLGPIAFSGWDYLRTRPPERLGLNRLLLLNPASGCTMMFNRALRELARPIPPEAVMHDYWLILVAAACGHLAWLSEPTVLYRRHQACATATPGWSPSAIVRRLRAFGDIRQEMARNRTQAKVFCQRYGQKLRADDRRLLEDYLTLAELGRWRRLRAIWHHRLFYPGRLRNLGWLLMG